MIKLINEQVLYIDNDYIKEAYQHEYIIQVNLSTVNGVTLRDHANRFHLTKDVQPIANIFFKVCCFHDKSYSLLIKTRKASF